MPKIDCIKITTEKADLNLRYLLASIVKNTAKYYLMNSLEIQST